MTRLEHYIDSMNQAQNEDAKKGVLIILLAEYSRNVISRIGDTKLIKEWLEEKERE